MNFHYIYVVIIYFLYSAAELYDGISQVLFAKCDIPYELSVILVNHAQLNYIVQARVFLLVNIFLCQMLMI